MANAQNALRHDFQDDEEAHDMILAADQEPEEEATAEEAEKDLNELCADDRGRRHGLDSFFARLSKPEYQPLQPALGVELAGRLFLAISAFCEQTPGHRPSEDTLHLLVEAGWTEDAQIMEILVRTNLRFAVSQARRAMISKGQPFDALPDLINSATIGLVRGVARFNPTLGFSFTSYACWSIKNAIDEWFFRHEGSNSRRVQAASLTLAAEDDRGPILEVPDEQTELADEHCARKEQRAYVRNLMRMLTDRERRVLELRFGEPEHTLKEAGEALGITHQAVRKIQDRAFSKLKWRIGVRASVENDRAG